ncbi:MAG: hypothetical protein ACOY40_07745 [Bacillota bacterium]
MSALNDRELMVYAFREALSRERRMAGKLKFLHESTRDRNVKKLCSGMILSCMSRITILQKEIKNLYIK